MGEEREIHIWIKKFDKKSSVPRLLPLVLVEVVILLNLNHS